MNFPVKFLNYSVIRTNCLLINGIGKKKNIREIWILGVINYV